MVVGQVLYEKHLYNFFKLVNLTIRLFPIQSANWVRLTCPQIFRMSHLLTRDSSEFSLIRLAISHEYEWMRDSWGLPFVFHCPYPDLDVNTIVNRCEAVVTRRKALPLVLVSNAIFNLLVSILMPVSRFLVAYILLVMIEILITS